MKTLSAIIATLVVLAPTADARSGLGEQVGAWRAACFGNEPVAVSEQQLSSLRDQVGESALLSDCEATRATARSVFETIDAWLAGADGTMAPPDLAQTFRRLAVDASDSEAALLLGAARDGALRSSLSPPTGITLRDTATVLYRALVAGQIVQTDTANQALLRRFLDENGWPRDENLALAAWLIAQHADGDRPLQARALELLEPLVRDDRASAMRFSLLHDRWAVGVGQAQRFGWQGNCRDGEWVLTGDGDPDVARRQRALFGLENYDQWAAERCAWQ